MGRGGARQGAGRRQSGPATLQEAVRELRGLLDEAERPFDKTHAQTLAQRIFQGASRLRRRLLRSAP